MRLNLVSVGHFSCTSSDGISCDSQPSPDSLMGRQNVVESRCCHYRYRCCSWASIFSTIARGLPQRKADESHHSDKITFRCCYQDKSYTKSVLRPTYQQTSHGSSTVSCLSLHSVLRQTQIHHAAQTQHQPSHSPRPHSVSPGHGAPPE